MSRNSSFLTRNTSSTPINITLLDTTEARFDDPDTNAEQENSEAGESGQTLSRKPTASSFRASVKDQYNRQKYAKHQKYRYEQEEEATTSDGPQGVITDSTQPGRIERGRAKAAAFWRGKKRLEKADGRDRVIDILYENQRGVFAFGVPRFSSKSLLQFDAKPWQNADFRTSAVDIRNAQVPDPSWDWVWQNWFVDMSRDVDEEGWEYSFAFGSQFAWHGTHPWFHSFVRRRRWLRMRVRKDTKHKTKEASHELAPDYFTIHTGVLSSGSKTEGRSNADPLTVYEDDLLDELDVTTMASLLRHMAKARLDREKLVALRSYVSQGGDDLRYLADRMSEVMSLFIYQSSRRQIIDELEAIHKAALDEQKQGRKEDSEKLENKIQYLRRAIDAADTEAQRFEYWSDIKEMASQDEIHLGDKAGEWNSKRWQGVDQQDKSAFRDKQAASDPPAELHDHPEPLPNIIKRVQSQSEDTDSSGYTTAPSAATSMHQKPSFTTRRSSSKLKDDEIGSDLERFVTASEGPVSSIEPKQIPNKQSFRRKKRGGAPQLDGVAEHEDESMVDTAADEDEEEEDELEQRPLQEVDAETSRLDD